MNKKTLLYGLIALGGVLVYYAWKEHNLSSKNNSKINNTTPTSSTGTFVDDVPVNPEVLGIKSSNPTLLDSITNTVKSISEPLSSSVINSVKSGASTLVEPFFGTKNENQSAGQGEFADA